MKAKNSLFVSDADLSGTKELFENIKSLGQAQYCNLKRLKVGITITYEDMAFDVIDIKLQHFPENQFDNVDEESLDIHILVKEQY